MLRPGSTLKLTSRSHPSDSTRVAPATSPTSPRTTWDGHSPSLLDGTVLSVSVVGEPILGGSVNLSGFTLEDGNTVAMLLRSGTLPGRLSVVEQQVIEAASNTGNPQPRHAYGVLDRVHSASRADHRGMNTCGARQTHASAVKGRCRFL